MNKQCFFIDIDLTLYSHKTYKVPKINKKAIKQARAQGHKVFIATGRGPTGTNIIDSNLYDGMICSIGSYIKVADKVIFRSGINSKVIEQIKEILKGSDVEYEFIGEKHAYFDTDVFWDYIKIGVIEIMPQSVRKKNGFVTLRKHRKEYEEELNNGTIEKVTLRSHKGIKKEIYNKLKDLGMYVIDITQDDKRVYISEIANSGVSKGNGVKTIMNYLKLPIADAIAIGDSPNDIEMITSAGTGYAVANASPLLKKEADYVTTKDCGHGAVAEVIYKYIEKEE